MHKNLCFSVQRVSSYRCVKALLSLLVLNTHLSVACLEFLRLYDILPCVLNKFFCLDTDKFNENNSQIL